MPGVVSDPNGNRTAVAFDALGMVVASAVLGKEAGHGDELTGLAADLTAAQVRAAFADPFADPHALLGKATQRFVYDFFAYQRSRDDAQPVPAGAYTLTRETHEADLAAGAPNRRPARLLLLRRLRPGDPEEGPGRAGPRAGP